MIKSQTFSSLTYQPIFMYLSNIIKVCHLICRQVYSGKIQLLMILDESIEGSRLLIEQVFWKVLRTF